MLKKDTIVPHCGIKNKINHRFPTDLDQRNVRIAMEPTQWKRGTEINPRRVFVNNFSAAGAMTLAFNSPSPSLQRAVFPSKETCAQCSSSSAQTHTSPSLSSPTPPQHVASTTNTASSSPAPPPKRSAPRSKQLSRTTLASPDPRLHQRLSSLSLARERSTLEWESSSLRRTSSCAMSFCHLTELHRIWDFLRCFLSFNLMSPTLASLLHRLFSLLVFVSRLR
ncbi:hypothetical protein LB505_008881 [Fusarium chuoi]|nr:hypothetical protein LB505_008881 [Fusarium chuoi]